MMSHSTDILKKYIELKNQHPGVNNELICEKIASEILETLGMEDSSYDERYNNRPLREALVNMFIVGYKVAQTTIQ